MDGATAVCILSATPLKQAGFVGWAINGLSHSFYTAEKGTEMPNSRVADSDERKVQLLS